MNPGATSAIKIMDFDCMGADKPFSDLEAYLGENKRESSVYVAPELIHGKWHLLNDEWSVGVIMYFMITGNPPFYSDTYRETLK